MSGPKTSDRLDMPEVATPHQSPQQKQLKMADLEARATMLAPTGDELSSQPGNRMSSQVCCTQMPEQGLLRLALQ